MCREKRKLPIGIENFEQIIKDDFYYVDKTGLISELLRNWGMVNLFTRPRRFGKSLNMSMLEHFFSVEGDKSIFDGLKISKDKKLCEEYMGKHPVISISLKGINAASYEAAFELTVKTIKGAVQKAGFLKMSDKLGEDEKKEYRAILDENMSEATLFWSLKNLSELLEKHYETKVILLIDEYDVPLAKAFENGYYDKMVFLIRNLLEQTLKTNNSLKFAVMTGCMRISKESIFTGLNNLKVLSITDERFDEYFGFTDEDVKEMLRYYDREDHYEEMRNWYDGYRFGSTDVYCPWDVMNYMLELQRDPKAKPISYWKNTSDNAIIRSFIDYAGSTITNKLEILMAGGCIVQRVDENLTYDYLHASEDNLWSTLYLTGYLTRAREADYKGEVPDSMVALMIPNAEIREIFETTVIRWFDDSTKKWNRSALFDAVWRGDSEGMTKEMNALLRRTISYHDYREDFYHAFLAGIFTGAGYMVDSNKEHGEGRSDVVVYDPVNARVAIFEAKYTKTLENLERECDMALQQIDDRMYAAEYEDDYDQILCYGISFFRKRCMVKKKG